MSPGPARRCCSSPAMRRRTASAPSRALHEREDVVFALFGGRCATAPPADGRPPFPHRARPSASVAAARRLGRLPRRGAGPSGRVALPAAYAGARRAGVPFVLWASLWAHPRSFAPRSAYLPLRHVYRAADAVVTYGPHVSAYVRAPRRRATCTRHRRPWTTSSGARRAEPAPVRTLPTNCCLSAERRGKRASRRSCGPGAPRASEHLAPRWCWSAAARPCPGRRHQRGRRRRTARRRRAAQLLRRVRRSRRTVGPDARRFARPGASSSTKP